MFRTLKHFSKYSSWRSVYRTRIFHINTHHSIEASEKTFKSTYVIPLCITTVKCDTDKMSDDDNFYNLDIKTITNDSLEALKKMIKNEYQSTPGYGFAVVVHNNRNYFVVIKTSNRAEHDFTESYYKAIIEEEYMSHSLGSDSVCEIKQIIDLHCMKNIEDTMTNCFNHIKSGLRCYHETIQGAFFLQQSVPENYTGYWFFCGKTGEKHKMSEFRDGKEIRCLHFAVAL